MTTAHFPRMYNFPLNFFFLVGLGENGIICMIPHVRLTAFLNVHVT